MPLPKRAEAATIGRFVGDVLGPFRFGEMRRRCGTFNCGIEGWVVRTAADDECRLDPVRRG